MKGILTLAAVLLGFTATSGAQSPPPAGTATAETIQNGRKLYTSYGCSACHGGEAQGSSAGPRLARHPGTLAAFTAYLRRPTNQMPPYTAKVLSDKDVADIDAFVKSIPPPKAVKDIPLLNQ